MRKTVLAAFCIVELICTTTSQSAEMPASRPGSTTYKVVITEKRALSEHDQTSYEGSRCRYRYVRVEAQARGRLNGQDFDWITYRMFRLYQTDTRVADGEGQVLALEMDVGQEIMATEYSAAIMEDRRGDWLYVAHSRGDHWFLLRSRLREGKLEAKPEWQRIQPDAEMRLPRWCQRIALAQSGDDITVSLFESGEAQVYTLSGTKAVWVKDADATRQTDPSPKRP